MPAFSIVVHMRDSQNRHQTHFRIEIQEYPHWIILGDTQKTPKRRHAETCQTIRNLFHFRRLTPKA